MARRKEISKQRIFSAAYKLALKNGIDSLTARNIAKAVNCSTQPIYLEFKNMGDLRMQVLKQMVHKLETTTLQQVYVDRPLIDFDLSYIDFATDAPALFKSIFIDGKFGNDFVSHIMMNLGTQKLGEEIKLDQFSAEHINNMVISNWINVNGLASMAINGMLNLEQDQIVNLLESQLHSAMLSDPLSREQTNQMFAEGENASLANKLS